jgi:hypothetical protein
MPQPSGFQYHSHPYQEEEEYAEGAVDEWPVDDDGDSHMQEIPDEEEQLRRAMAESMQPSAGLNVQGTHIP